MSRTDRAILKSMIKHVKGASEDPLTALIDEYLVKRDRPPYASRRLQSYEIDTRTMVRPPGRFSPSSLCGCQRQSALTFLGVGGRKKLDPDTELIFEDGHWRHHKWDYIFLDMEKVLGRKRFRVVSIEFEATFRNLFIRGHFDAHIQIFVDGEWIDYIVDFKGANNWTWETSYRRRQPVHEHTLQILAYMKAKKVDRGLLLYDSKERSKFYVFPVTYTPDGWAEVQDWTRKVKTQVEEQKLPPMHPACDNGNFLANRCPFKGLCFGDMSTRQIQRLAYRDFTSMDDLWDQGMEIEQSGVESV